MAAAVPPSRFGTLVIAALVLVLSWQLAHWTWVYLAPAPQAPAAPPHESSVDLAVAARLFGGTVGSSATPAASTAGGLRLKGVVAPTPGTAASAIFSTGAGRDLAVYIDSEVQPGVKLVEVHPDSVVISRAGVRERIALEKPLAAAPSARGPRGAPPAGFRLKVAQSGSNSFTLSRKDLDDALKDPNQLNYLGRIGVAPQGGVVLEAAPAGSLAQKLGFLPGDVIRKVNGQNVASPGDLARLYTQFATLSLVQAEVRRAGSTVQLSYAIQP
jgi:type II secretory pathway component PulC